MQYIVVSLNRGSSLSEHLPEQINLDRIYNFKFGDHYVKAKTWETFKTESHYMQAIMHSQSNVFSYSHLVTVWINF